MCGEMGQATGNMGPHASLHGPFIKHSTTMNQKALNLFVGAVFATVAIPAVSAQQFTTSTYIEIETATKTAPFFGFDAVNQVLTPYPVAPWNGSTSYVQFPSPLWILGVDWELVTFDTNMKEENVSNMPSFTEFNHHLVLGSRAMNSAAPLDLFLGCGSELTDFMLPAGYGLPVQGLEIGGATWHWHNASGVALNGLRVFVKMNVTWEASAANVPNPVSMAWLGSFVVPVPGGVSTQTTNSIPTGTTPFEIVAVYPHVHDHCTDFRLMSSATGVVQSFVPANSNSYPVEHDAVGTGPNAPWHSHGSGTGHLPVGGLTTWVPGPSTVFTTPNSTLWIEGDFDSPHSTHSIDNMLVGIMFFK